jgi:hypothetical protein
MLARAASWLLPGGLLVLTLPDARSWTATAMGRHWFYYAAPDHVHYFTPATIRRCLADAGFTDVTVHAATKPLTLDYATEQLARMTPALAPLAKTVQSLTPRRLRAHLWPLPIGEMLVTARPAS